MEVFSSLAIGSNSVSLDADEVGSDAGGFGNEGAVSSHLVVGLVGAGCYVGHVGADNGISVGWLVRGVDRANGVKERSGLVSKRAHQVSGVDIGDELVSQGDEVLEGPVGGSGGISSNLEVVEVSSEESSSGNFSEGFSSTSEVLRLVRVDESLNFLKQVHAVHHQFLGASLDG